MISAWEQSKKNLQKAVPAMAYSGGDPESWKPAAREKLRNLLCLHKILPVQPQLEIDYEKVTSTHTELRFSFQSEAGYRIPCHLLLPHGVKNPPVIICLQGHSTGMHISLGISKYPGDEQTIAGGDRDFCVRAIREGYAAIAMDQRGFGECGGTEKGPRCYEAAMTCLLQGRTLLGERVWDVCRLIDLLETSFADRVDVKRICLMGNSGGGTVTAYTAALDDRLVLAMPSSAVCTFRESIGAVYHCSCNYIPDIANWFDMGDLIAMAYPKYYIQVNGVKDPSFSISGAKAAFEAGKYAYIRGNAADRCTFIEGQEGHRFYADLAWPIVHKYIGKI